MPMLPGGFGLRAEPRHISADMEEAFGADESLDAFEAAGRRTRPLAALKSEIGL
ncbi:hypothetical protein [Salinibacterium sp.]|uniref:hypothetical protein n=1 Tax=Salinibacterium sp. TaxID=1915057 RepID=UPI00286B54F0|nr:hypothetical protein [Salinibacterium sp.]